MRFAPDQPLFNARRSDDPFHRIQVLAEKRATANGFDPVKAGRAAMALLGVLKDEANSETILQVVAGPFRRAA